MIARNNKAREHENADQVAAAIRLYEANVQDLFTNYYTYDRLRIIYTRQNQPLGLGHAIWCARNIVGNEPFAVLLADDLIKAQTPVLKQMIEKFDALQSSIVSVVEVDRQDTSKYGILDADPLVERITKIRGLVEKPKPEKAPSNLAIIGRYILTPEIFDILENKEVGAGGEAGGSHIPDHLFLGHPNPLFQSPGKTGQVIIVGDICVHVS